MSWNVNSIRSRSRRLDLLIDRLDPDVVLLQETKCTDETFASVTPTLRARGYDIAHHGVDHWNGVAIVSRVGLESVAVGFSGTTRAPFDEARLIAATCGGLRVHSVYVPNGRELDDPHYLFKLVWLERLRSEIDASTPTIVAGDFNVAPADRDIYDPTRFRRKTHASPAERAAIDSLLDLGLVDMATCHRDDDPGYTFWNYRPGQFERDRGLRIDLALGTDDVAARARDVWVDRGERTPDPDARHGEKPSDHAPLVIDLDVKAHS